MPRARVRVRFRVPMKVRACLCTGPTDEAQIAQAVPSSASVADASLTLRRASTVAAACLDD